MIIDLNGKRCHVADGTLLGELIQLPRGSAAVVDGEVVPRSHWEVYRLVDGQSVEIVTAVQGG